MNSLVERLRSKYPELKEEPMIDELEMALEEPPMEEIEEEDDMEFMSDEELLPEEGDEDMLENYEDDDMLAMSNSEDIDMMANEPDMRDEGLSKKEEHKRRMALRRALSGKA